jgi:hypothetical protein
MPCFRFYVFGGLLLCFPRDIFKRFSNTKHFVLIDAKRFDIQSSTEKVTSPSLSHVLGEPCFCPKLGWAVVRPDRSWAPVIHHQPTVGMMIWPRVGDPQR